MADGSRWILSKSEGWKRVCQFKEPGSFVILPKAALFDVVSVYPYSLLTRLAFKGLKGHFAIFFAIAEHGSPVLI